MIRSGFTDDNASTIKTARLKCNARRQSWTENLDLFTRPNFGQPGRIIGSCSFGQIIKARFPARRFPFRPTDPLYSKALFLMEKTRLIDR